MSWRTRSGFAFGVASSLVLLAAHAGSAATATNYDGALIEQLTPSGFVAQHTPQPDLPAATGNEGWVSNGIGAISTSDAWAVGRFSDRTGKWHAATEHWNGRSWQNISNAAAPVPAALNAVDGAASNDVWAVGYHVLPQQSSQAPPVHGLIEHWDGTSWSVASSPSPLDSTDPGEDLVSVSADRSTDAWAVGRTACTSSVGCGVFERWNGESWTLVSSGIASASVPTSVSADSPSDAWAAMASTKGQGQNTAAIAHWNGRRWIPITTAVPSGFDGLSVWAGSPHDVWLLAIGTTDEVIAHWDGTSWAITYDEPNYGSSIFWSGVSGTTSSNVYAVGALQGDPVINTAAQHWNGSSWSGVATQSPTTANVQPPNSYPQDQLVSVSVVRGGAFAAGSQTAFTPG